MNNILKLVFNKFLLKKEQIFFKHFKNTIFVCIYVKMFKIFNILKYWGFNEIPIYGIPIFSNWKKMELSELYYIII